MKTIIVSFILLVLSCGYSMAGDCKIPDFVKKGAKVEVWVFGGAEKVAIVEVDENKCYLKADNGYWYNINAIYMIKPL